MVAQAGDHGSTKDGHASSNNIDSRSSEGGSGGSSRQDRKAWIAKEEGKQMHRELHSLNVGERSFLYSCYMSVSIVTKHFKRSKVQYSCS